ncbi:hypothetical protein AB6G58_22750 [Providencia huaxiensis]
MKPIPFDKLAKRAHEMGLITGVAVHGYSSWQWARAEFDIPTVGLKTSLLMRYLYVMVMVHHKN